VAKYRNGQDPGGGEMLGPAALPLRLALFTKRSGGTMDG